MHNRLIETGFFSVYSGKSKWGRMIVRGLRLWRAEQGEVFYSLSPISWIVDAVLWVQSTRFPNCY